jgi:hypothetical protein
VSENQRSEIPAQAFPTIRVGGLFVGLVGVVVLVSSIFGGHHLISAPLFFVGFGLAIGGVLFNVSLRAKLASGELSPKQRNVLRGALILEAALIIGASVLVGGNNERLYWLLILLAVAIHFLPLVAVHGPLMGALGVLCTINALVGLLFPQVPFLVTAIADGLLKIVFGSLMLVGRPRLVAGGA